MEPIDQKNYIGAKLQRQIAADTLDEAARLIIKAVIYVDQVCKAGRIPEQDIDILEEMSSCLQKDATKLIELGDVYVSDTAS